LKSFIYLVHLTDGALFHAKRSGPLSLGTQSAILHCGEQKMAFFLATSVAKDSHRSEMIKYFALQNADLSIGVQVLQPKAANIAAQHLWGEQSTLNVKSGDDVADLSDEELERRLADIDGKESTLKEPKAA
jgi:hypothetical protein